MCPFTRKVCRPLLQLIGISGVSPACVPRGTRSVQCWRRKGPEAQREEVACPGSQVCVSVRTAVRPPDAGPSGFPSSDCTTARPRSHGGELHHPCPCPPKSGAPFGRWSWHQSLHTSQGSMGYLSPLSLHPASSSSANSPRSADAP